jgi:tetratricopeptide (TPR) repeat protein
VRLSPDNTTSQSNLVENFIKLNRFDEAKQVLEQTLGQNPDRSVYRFYSYQLAFIGNDQATMKREVDWLSAKQAQPDFFDLQAMSAAFYGQWRKSLDFTRRSRELLMSQDRKENAGQNETNVAFLEAAFGRCPQAKQSAERGLSLSRGIIGLQAAAMALALCNEQGQAQALIDETVKRFPKDSIGNNILLPMIRATLETSRGNSAQAIQILQPAGRFELGAVAGFWMNYIRGQAYLRQGSGKEAAAEFQKILDHRGIDALSPLYPLAHVGLARAAALSGNTAMSRKEYQDFFALWKDADADLPILIQAKKEYEQLK